VAALVVAVAGLAGCSSSAPGADVSPHTSPPAVRAPLDATFGVTTGVAAVVAMGKVTDRLNTFWQVFFRGSATSRWALVTPPGVADNGGLVVSVGPSADPTGRPLLFAGFEPSQALSFSPLALSVDEGGSWSPGLVAGGLSAVPDALSGSSASGLVALVRAGGGEVLRSTGNASVWSKLVGRDAMASSVAGKSCGVAGLTAVSLDTTEGVQVGTSCTSPGVVGIFESVGGRWRLVGPRLSGQAGTEPTKVLRLVDVNNAASGLVAVGNRSATSLVAVTSETGGAWSRSAPLPMSPQSRILSTGIEPGGGFVVLTSRSKKSLALEVETEPGGSWQSLPAPPPGTAAVAVGTGGGVDALAVASTQLTDWRLDAPAGTWSKIGTVTVPIQFGSSA
jgi:hypothetical protein